MLHVIVNPTVWVGDAALHAPTRRGRIRSVMLHVIVNPTVWVGDAAAYCMEYG